MITGSINVLRGLVSKKYPAIKAETMMAGRI
jgi:hypothetical protein